ncbi:YraN family protein [Clostridium sp. AWRP]|uniref:YraN family protein n=1 Tax=Clostridium sp. AWRP TaxID=2212991 RepID=UPI000FDC42BA|nr:YraN family protein [Clostridium sp. AWRP]AZV56292.1 YraN family protein [Clostridium sp. AWRP]
MHSFNKDIGSLGEDISEIYLKQIGYTLLERNFHCKLGEIDIIGKDGNYICFIEVKTRCNTLYGNPGEAVNFTKRMRICNTAKMYITKKNLFRFNFRFDVIEVMVNPHDGISSIRLIKDAFEI